MNPLEKLQQLRQQSGKAKTTGLTDEQLKPFIDSDPLLPLAINEAVAARAELATEFSDLINSDESEVICHLQAGIVNFYDDAALNPYVPIAARGPWLVTLCGAVVHDSGGYGMLGFGHAPESVLTAMNQPHIMANIMTPSFSHARFVKAMRQEVGYRRSGTKPFSHFICMNSGSEAMSVACRIADVNTKQKHNGRKVKTLALKQGFHGRTDTPAHVSDSSLPKYREHCYSFAKDDDLVTVPINDIKQLEAAFAAAKTENVYFSACMMEPVMGEGNPGEAVTREFFSRARELTIEHETLLIVDSIQASLRTQGCLSIVDYPGFENLPGPDIESYSKALNAGQYPLSVLALSESTAGIYKKGIYGNTMTTNPRALDVASAVLNQVTPALRENIQGMGRYFLAKLRGLMEEFPGVVLSAQGTGLLLSSEFEPSKVQVVGFDCLEEKVRVAGIGIIHGGKNALRFTPHFNINQQEIDLMIDVVRQSIKKALN